MNRALVIGISTALAVALMLTGAVILVVGSGGAIGFAMVAVGLAVTALLAADKRRHGPAH